MEGWYYLHENGELIYKRELGGTAADIRESDFARGMWPIDPTDREGAWTILVEGLAAGAKAERIKELANKWKCTDEDGLIYADRVGAKVQRDGDQWLATRSDFQNIQESPSPWQARSLLRGQSGQIQSLAIGLQRCGERRSLKKQMLGLSTPEKVVFGGSWPDVARHDLSALRGCCRSA